MHRIVRASVRWGRNLRIRDWQPMSVVIPPHIWTSWRSLRGRSRGFGRIVHYMVHCRHFLPICCALAANDRFYLFGSLSLTNSGMYKALSCPQSGKAVCRRLSFGELGSRHRSGSTALVETALRPLNPAGWQLGRRRWERSICATVCAGR